MVGRSIKTANDKVGIIVESHHIPHDPKDDNDYSHVIRVMFPNETKGKVYVVNVNSEYNNYIILGADDE
tara:strand:+ start:381 stop:587 length:207 start_codon:yes stop_codon:yes gene_type:complete